MIEIDKRIPIPKQKSGGSRAKYPFADMEVGDSFFVPDTTSAVFCGNLSNAKKRLKAKFSLRTVDGGGRVWRVE